MALSASTRCVCSINGVRSKDGNKGDVQGAGTINTRTRKKRRATTQKEMHSEQLNLHPINGISSPLTP